MTADDHSVAPMKLLPIYFDKVFRLLFDDTHDARILISFLNAILHLEGAERIVSLALTPREIQGDTPDDKEVILDIQATDDLKRLISVEIQVSSHGFYRARALYYACGLFYQQLKEGQKYKDLRPAIAIHLLCFNLWTEREVPHVHSRFEMRERQTQRLFSELLELHVLELEKLPWNALEPGLLKTLDLGEIWLYLIRYGHTLTREVAQAVLPPEVQEAYGRLEMLSAEPNLQLAYLSLEKRKRDAESYIPDLMEDSRQKGLREGLLLALERMRELGRLTQGEFEAEKARLEAEAIPNPS